MVDCDYCGASFEGEDAYLEHLGDAHQGELGSIDQRRVEDHGGGSGGSSIPTGPVILVGVIGFALAIVVYVVMFMGGGGSGGEPITINGIDVDQSPATGTAHEHGTINVTIDGQRIDFSQSEYQGAANSFHFENGNGRTWHKHSQGVTLEYAMATLGIAVSGDSVTFEGTSYRDGENAAVVVEVNGDPVDPSSYVLQGTQADNGQDGDHVRIVVRTTG